MDNCPYEQRSAVLFPRVPTNSATFTICVKLASPSMKRIDTQKTIGAKVGECAAGKWMSKAGNKKTSRCPWRDSSKRESLYSAASPRKAVGYC